MLDLIPAVAKAATERLVALDRRGRVKKDLKDSLTMDPRWRGGGLAAEREGERRGRIKSKAKQRRYTATKSEVFKAKALFMGGGAV